MLCDASSPAGADEPDFGASLLFQKIDAQFDFLRYFYIFHLLLFEIVGDEHVHEFFVQFGVFALGFTLVQHGFDHVIARFAQYLHLVARSAHFSPHHIANDHHAGSRVINSWMLAIVKLNSQQLIYFMTVSD